MQTHDLEDQLQNAIKNPKVRIRRSAAFGISGCTCCGGWGCIILFIVGIFAFIFGIIGYISVYVEDTWFVPGDADNFDAIAAFPEVRDYAGSTTKLMSIEARFVRSDGTMNLNAEYLPAPQTEYTFFRELDETPEDAPPLGAGSNTDGRWFEEVTVMLSDPGDWRHTISGNSEYDWVNLGMQRDTGSPTSTFPGEAAPDPTCSFKELWDAAIERGAPPDAVATITYTALGYTFEINEIDIRLRFGLNCSLRG